MRRTALRSLRSTLPRHATPAAPDRQPLKPAPLNLLPPLPLYRRLFRAHRKHLGASERVLGDSYVKAEFRAHQKIDNPIQIVGFLTEWQLYAQQVEGDSWRDGKLQTDKYQKMSDEQIYQLYELMRAIQGQEEGDEPGDADAAASAAEDAAAAAQGKKDS